MFQRFQGRLYFIFCGCAPLPQGRVWTVDPSVGPRSPSCINTNGGQGGNHTQVRALDRESNARPFGGWADALTTSNASQGWAIAFHPQSDGPAVGTGEGVTCPGWPTRLQDRERPDTGTLSFL